jgi:hypothetical protein
MSDPTGGELSPGTAPSSSPSPAPSAPSSPATPPERKSSTPNPRANARRPHWSDGKTGETRWLEGERARRAAAAEPPSPGTTAAPGEQPQPDDQPAPAELSPIERTEDGRFRFSPDLALSETELRELLAFKAADDSRRATLTDPSAYKLALPADFVTPAGVEFSFSEDDPRARLAREFAFEAGLSQAQFERLIAIDAARQVEEIANFNRMVGNEVKKLGATGTQRVTAIQNFLRGSLGDELARPFIETLVSERMVKGWEQIIQRITGQGAGSYSSAHRDAPESNGQIPGYENMSFEARLAAGEALRRRNQR